MSRVRRRRSQRNLAQRHINARRRALSCCAIRTGVVQIARRQTKAAPWSTVAKTGFDAAPRKFFRRGTVIATAASPAIRARSTHGCEMTRAANKISKRALRRATPRPRCPKCDFLPGIRDHAPVHLSGIAAVCEACGRREEPSRALQKSAPDSRTSMTTADFFDLPATVAGDAVGADLISYEICIEDGARQHCVTFVDDDSRGTTRLRRLKDTLLAVGASGSP
jgi:hypothetical protein